jgi:fibronectin type 3 domain-containing protein
MWPQSMPLSRVAEDHDDKLIDLRLGSEEMPAAPETGPLALSIEREDGTYVVKLSWTASISQNVAGYNVYRGTTPGGPYMKLNSTLHKNTSYTDRRVNDGETYYYVTTAVNSTGQESEYSNQAEAVIP